jgi:PadR family transcriptional regulator, regulatory protein PadR
MTFTREMTAASTKPLVLGILARGESYGYEIIQQVKELSGGKMEWPEGVLYPVLHRLERQKLIESFWRTSEQGRKRKYYRITQQGKKALAAERTQWQVAAGVLDRLWLPQLNPT